MWGYASGLERKLNQRIKLIGIQIGCGYILANNLKDHRERIKTPMSISQREMKSGLERKLN